jgi:hypothetical protein
MKSCFRITGSDCIQCTFHQIIIDASNAIFQATDPDQDNRSGIEARIIRYTRALTGKCSRITPARDPFRGPSIRSSSMHPMPYSGQQIPTR